MKMFCLILTSLLMISVSYGQKDSVMCLSKPEVLMLANKIQTLQDSSIYKSTIIQKQNKLITTYGELKIVSDERIQNQKETIDLIHKQNEELKKQIEYLRPKWYDDNRLWFTTGVVITTIIFLVGR